MQEQEQREHFPVEYAQGRVADSTERIARGTVTQIRKQGGKAGNDIKERQWIKREEKQIWTELSEGRIPGQGERPSFSPAGGEKAYQPKEQMIKTAQSQAARKRVCQSFLSVQTVRNGFRAKDSLRMEVMFRQRGILFSLTGKMTEVLTM